MLFSSGSGDADGHRLCLGISCGDGAGNRGCGWKMISYIDIVV